MELHEIKTDMNEVVFTITKPQPPLVKRLNINVINNRRKQIAAQIQALQVEDADLFSTFQMINTELAKPETQEAIEKKKAEIQAEIQKKKEVFNGVMITRKMLQERAIEEAIRKEADAAAKLEQDKQK